MKFFLQDAVICHLGTFSRFHRDSPAQFWRFFLFWSFWLSLALFPIGYGFREVMPPLCLIFLLLYYRHAWRQSVLASLRPAWLFLCPLAMTTFAVIFSAHPWPAFLHAAMGLNKAYILPFIAMECARSLTDLKRLAWACGLACFWQGLDGIWQAFTGYDLIMGYPFRVRLTGSLGDYTVGNYLALAMVPAFGIWQILRQKLPTPACALLLCALLWPAVFLFLGASSRSGILAIAVCLAIWSIWNYGFFRPIWLLLPATAVGIFLLFQGSRFSTVAILGDSRWDLWSLAWKIFEKHPWLGAGPGQYNTAFRELGLAPVQEAITISHPHNLYLDLLYAHGLVGFCLGMTFLLGFAFWGFRRLRSHIPARSATERGLYWTLAAWFWLGYIAWLVNGIFGHDFYRIWWLALAMCNMGIMIGAVSSGPGCANQTASNMTDGCQKET